jgi:hypothetical protein
MLMISCENEVLTSRTEWSSNPTIHSSDILVEFYCTGVDCRFPAYRCLSTSDLWGCLLVPDGPSNFNSSSEVRAVVSPRVGFEFSLVGLVNQYWCRGGLG